MGRDMQAGRRTKPNAIPSVFFSGLARVNKRRTSLREMSFGDCGAFFVLSDAAAAACVEAGPSDPFPSTALAFEAEDDGAFEEAAPCRRSSSCWETARDVDSARLPPAVDRFRRSKGDEVDDGARAGSNADGTGATCPAGNECSWRLRR